MSWLAAVIGCASEEAAPPPAEVAAPPVAAAVAPPPVPPAPAAATPSGCREVFTAEHATETYAAIGALVANDSCTFEGVEAAASSMALQWKVTDGRVVRWLVEPSACAASPSAVYGPLALTAADGDRQACPARWAATVALLQGNGLRGPNVLTDQPVSP